MKLTIEELMKENGISNAEQRLGDWCVWYRGKMFVGKTLRGAIEEARQSKDKVLKQELDGLLEEYKINSNDDTFNKIWKWVISIKK